MNNDKNINVAAGPDGIHGMVLKIVQLYWSNH